MYLKQGKKKPRKNREPKSGVVHKYVCYVYVLGAYSCVCVCVYVLSVLRRGGGRRLCAMMMI